MASYAATFAATAAFGLAACAAFLDEQDKAGALPGDGSAGFETVAETEGEMVTGGYGTGDLEEDGAKTALSIATEAIYQRYPTRALVEAVTLETQVVAGLNYRYSIEMSGSQNARGIYEATVYRDLDDNFELTSLAKLQ